MPALHRQVHIAMTAVDTCLLWAGCCQIPEGEPVSAAVDGEDGRSWHLPLPPLHASSLPEPYSPGDLLV